MKLESSITAKKMLVFGLFIVLFGSVFYIGDESEVRGEKMMNSEKIVTSQEIMVEEIQEEMPVKIALATFAGGCFWCMEPPFEKEEGVLSVTSGYSGGEVKNPTYKQVASGRTSHIETIQIEYNPSKISYKQLLEIFWRQINPTDAGGQFVDRGGQYRSAIFYHSEEQKKIAQASRTELNASGIFSEPVITEIIPFTAFYPAEDYHQDYYKKNPLRYKYYRYGSGRDQFLNKIWTNIPKKAIMNQFDPKNFVKPSVEELKEQLTPLQFKVTQQNGTERSFKNEYWDNKEDGIYVDIVSGEPLFSSTHKYKSGTGWPSFYEPLVKDNIVEHTDKSWFMTRTEVRSKYADSHLGHVFKDGPEPTGLRYCINSASLRFVPKEKLEEQGYGDYLYLFN